MRPPTCGRRCPASSRRGCSTRARSSTPGQTLYQIDPSLYRAAAAQAQANLASAQALQTATRAQGRPLQAAGRRSRRSASRTIPTPGDRGAGDGSGRAEPGALADRQRSTCSFTKVPAPITGRIGRSLFTTGALVTAGQTNALTTIQRLDPIFVDIQQSSADLLALRRALAASGDDSSRQRRGAPDARGRQRLRRDRHASNSPKPVVDPTTGTVTLRARFPNPPRPAAAGHVRPRPLRAGDRAERDPGAAAGRHPRSARQRDRLLVVGPDNKAELRQVTGRPDDRRQMAGDQRARSPATR